MTTKAEDFKLHILLEKAPRTSPNGKKLPIGRGYLTEKGHCTKKFVVWSTKKQGLYRVKEDLGQGNNEPTATFFMNEKTAKNGSLMLTLRGGYDAEDNKIDGFQIHNLAFFMVGFSEPGMVFTDKWSVQSTPITLRLDDYYNGEKASTFRLEDASIEKSAKVLEAEAANTPFAEEFAGLRSVFGVEAATV